MTSSSSGRSIAIVGAACRLPGAVNSLGGLWKLLAREHDAIRAVPPGRWTPEDLAELPAPVVERMTHGGFLDDDVYAFDATWFGMSEQEARFTDPQHRLLLEVVWEALEHAGMPPHGLAGTRVAQLYGCYAKDYLLRSFGDIADTDPYAFLSGIDSMTTGRVAFLLDLRGPGAAVEGACASSVVAIHTACQALRAGEADLALAGGAQLSLSAQAMAPFARWEPYSRTGRSRPFDVRADGYARSEGCGIVVLKRLEDARRDGDRVLAVLRGSAVNTSGSRTRFTATSRTAQVEVYRAALERSGVDPADVGMVEAHGPGTAAGDPVEFAAVAEVYGRGRDRCALGSVKSNIGHCEAASGVAGLLKVIGALRHGAVPATLHFTRWNDAIDPAGTRLFVPTAMTRWPVTGGARLAAVSSFGVSGTNGHLVVEAAPERPRRPARAVPSTTGRDSTPPGPSVRAFCLSGRTEDAVRAGARRLADWLRDEGAREPLHDVAHTLAVRRSHAAYRAAVIAKDRRELVRRLGAFHAGKDSEVTPHTAVVPQAPGPGPVWVFPGHGSQWAGMCRELLDGDESFTSVIDELGPLVRAESGFLLRDVLTAPETVRGFGRVQPTLFAVQLGLAAMWRSWGVEPAAIIGYSMGEVAAAVAAGALTVADGVRVICRRSRRVATTAGRGLMASVALGHAEVERRLAEDGAAGVEVAVVTAPNATVVGGDADAVRALVERWDARGVAIRLVAVDAASHTAHMAPLRNDLLEELGAIRPARPQVPFYTTALADPRARAAFDGGYWFTNLRKPVRLAQAVRAAFEDGYRLFVELGPHPLLAAAIPACADGAVAVVPSLLRDHDDARTFLTHVTAYHAAGGVVDWSRHYGDGELVDAPPTTWDRRHLEVPAPARPAAGRPDGHPLTGPHLTDPETDGRSLWQTTILPERVPWLSDHAFNGVPVLPTTGCAEMCLQAATEYFRVSPRQVAVDDLRIHRALALARPTAVTMHATSLGSGRSRWTLESGNASDGRTRHATARLRLLPDDPPPAGQADLEALLRARQEDLDADDFYTWAHDRLGVGYGPAFRPLHSLRAAGGPAGSVLAHFALPDTARAGSRSMHCHPVLLDGAGQTFVAAWRQAAAVASGGLVGEGIGRLRLYGDLPPSGWYHAVVESSGPRSAVGRVRVLGEDGTVAAELHGVRAASVPLRTPEELFQSRLLEVAWSEQEPPTPADGEAGDWLLVHTGDRHPLAGPLAAALKAAGARATVVRDGDAPTPAELLADGERGRAGVVFLPASTADGEPPEPVRSARHHTTRLLELARTLAALETERPLRLWALTLQGEAVRQGEAPDLAQAGLRGALRTLGHEYPRLSPSFLDTDPHTPLRHLARELLACPASDDQIAYRHGRRLRAAVSPAPLTHGDRRTRTVDHGRDRVDLAVRTVGDIGSLELRAGDRRPPGPGEVEVHVHASGLNYANVLAATGVYQTFRTADDPAIRLAFDCAGLVSAVGDGVTHLEAGDRVALCVPTTSPSFSSFVTLPADWHVIPAPDCMSTTDAATLPLAYLTAWHGLRLLARLRPGERVLIHSASGGTGLAAVNVARLCGAHVLATAGSHAKRAYLRALGVEHVMDSRTVDFADEIRDLTDGQGVDVVLNSLTGPALSASLELLSPGGRFIEIGKRDVYDGTRISLLALRGNISFHVVDGGLLVAGSGFAKAAAKLSKALRQGLLPPLPVVTYPVDDAETAYRTMAQARHVAKLALTWPTTGTTTLPVAPEDVPVTRPDGAYVISGGLGGLGLLAADRLARSGAGTVVLASRHAPRPDTARAIERLRALGTRVEVVPADIAAPETAGRLVQAATATGHALRGVLHAAAVIDDATVATITPELVDRVWRPKALGAWHLHHATKDHYLDWWVAYSSSAATLGNAGQAAYSAANAWLEEFTSWRRAQGLPATCIAWGPWAEVGAGTAMRDRGYAMISPEDGMDALHRLLTHDRARTTYTPSDAHHWLADHPAADRLAYFAALLDDARASAAGTPSLLAALADRATDAERHRLLTQAVLDHTAAVLHRDPGSLTATTAFNTVGLDSLMATGLRVRLEADTGLRIPPSAMWAQPNPAALADYLLEHLDVEPVHHDGDNPRRHPGRCSTAQP
ncbi:type I polyketide synthase [Streptomyces huiliensis]|uniref:type I polyketide synthase n=1 Tax=Streptomyces huiliensis TaxID=2876027 RepID=UPI0021E02414|nr:type I polyketide synthase [Streptomyces huiliensis]MBZ4319960.1 type I polyketide synthase [Streptomyces huiliensis]